jgi:hypothetical protein
VRAFFQRRPGRVTPFARDDQLCVGEFDRIANRREIGIAKPRMQAFETPQRWFVSGTRIAQTVLCAFAQVVVDAGLSIDDGPPLYVPVIRNTGATKVVECSVYGAGFNPFGGSATHTPMRVRELTPPDAGLSMPIQSRQTEPIDHAVGDHLRR